MTYLAVLVTAVVFVAWYAAVQRLGVERTGLFTGLIPIASMTAVAVVGTSTITGMGLAGAVAVLAASASDSPTGQADAVRSHQGRGP